MVRHGVEHRHRVEQALFRVVLTIYKAARTETNTKQQKWTQLVCQSALAPKYNQVSALELARAEAKRVQNSLGGRFQHRCESLQHV